MRVNLLGAHGSPTHRHYRSGCRCLPCVSAMADHNRAYYAAHRQESAARQATYRSTHRPEIAKRNADYFERHREEMLAKKRAYHAAHREDLLARQRQHTLLHRDEIRAADRARNQTEARKDWRTGYRRKQREEFPNEIAERKRVYAETHRDAIAAYQSAYTEEHREQRRANNRNRRARKRVAPGNHTAADVTAQYLRQHGLCYWCGEKVGKDYHVDHVIPLARGGGNGPDNLVIACPTCNLAKGAKLPHEFSERMC